MYLGHCNTAVVTTGAHVPTLDTLSLNANWMVPGPDIIAQLREVRFTHKLKFTAWHLLQFLRATTRLESFIMESGIRFGDEEWDEFEGQIPYDSLEPLTQHRLHTFELSGGIETPALLDILLQCIRLPRARTIHINYAGLSCDDLYVLPEDLREIIPFLSSVTTLSLTLEEDGCVLASHTPDRRAFSIRLTYWAYGFNLAPCTAVTTVDALGSGFTRFDTAAWAALFGRFPRLARVSLVYMFPGRKERYDYREGYEPHALGALEGVLRRRADAGAPLEELTLRAVWEHCPDFIAEWRGRFEKAGVDRAVVVTKERFAREY
ncbi:uncharacterized protein BXZ73DRAFT_81228 [Epithele typhae]|uniref:uncharacterized protein n=1 Tax=Epithele typhae TaxID=378194 RepID=UPI002008406E|nr:uncharacterized protein BXZ73DRAFT_81228 [Epithele typhae]KAH9915961.1 hypothetical protein BXZ73DRAFT_81228 [Epithele typhae]